MFNALHDFVVGLPTFGWALLLLGWLMLSSAIVLFVWQSEDRQRRNREKVLMNRADLLADRLDEAADSLTARVPEWYPEEEAAFLIEELAAYAGMAEEARQDADRVRRWMIQGKFKTIEKNSRALNGDAAYLLRVSDDIRRRSAESVRRRLAMNAVELLGDWCAALRREVNRRNLSAIPNTIVNLELARAERAGELLALTMEEGGAPSQGRLLSILHVLTDLRQCDLLLAKCDDCTGDLNGKA
jgi:hypothetical protein